jgi:hypothetical protein
LYEVRIPFINHDYMFPSHLVREIVMPNDTLYVGNMPGAMTSTSHELYFLQSVRHALLFTPFK